jgi:hypothetical protein
MFLDKQIVNQNPDEEPKILNIFPINDYQNLTFVKFSLVTLILYFVCDKYPDAVTVILCKPDNNKRQ